MFRNHQLFIKKNSYSIIFWLLLTSISFAIFTYHSFTSDEGVILNMAWQMYNGKKLYTDFFEYLSPGSAYTTFLLWQLFKNTSYLIPAIFSWVLWLVSSIYLYLISKKISDNKIISFCIVVSWLLFIFLPDKINHNPHSSYISVIMLYYLLQYVEFEKKSYLVINGMLAALTTFFLHTKGLTVLIAGILSIVLLTKNKLIRSILFVITFLITGIVLYSPWNIDDLVQNIIIFPLEAKYVQTSQYSTEIIIVELFILVLMLAISIYKKNKAYWVLFIFQIALFAGSSYNINQAHLRINIFPFIPCYFLTIDHILRYKKISSKSINKIYLSILIILTLVIGIKFLIADNEHHSLHTDILKTNSVIDLQNYQIDEAKYIYAGPFLPGAYYELNKSNPFIYTHNMLYCLDECQTKTLEIIQTIKPEYAIMNYSQLQPKYNRDNLIDNYIKNTYMHCENTEQHLDIYALHECK